MLNEIINVLKKKKKIKLKKKLKYRIRKFNWLIYEIIFLCFRLSV